ncbi:MAG TPA: patatin-like phospholipase family protein, partial [Rubrobacter sp.]|nr:patatin-like phospholipase family protein [Rubrobacter sp.]
ARVAIACQGGGSHTAFTAGALKRLLADERHEVVALSGTSGGAICAVLAWYALLEKGGAGRAAELLDSFWRNNSARDFLEAFWNEWFLWVNRSQGSFVLPAVSPYDTPTSDWAQNQLRELLTDHVDFRKLKSLSKKSSPMLLIGAVDVLSGVFKAFSSRRDEITAEMILASTALPTLFKAVHADGGVYWDGLFSQNPPIRELPRAKPDEIWILQIDPKKRDEEPTSMTDILDRRNELAGNISLYQEVHFLQKMNHLVKKLGDPEVSPEERTLYVPGEEGEEDREYKYIDIRWIRMSMPLDFASKLDRNPSFIRRLMSYGERRAEDFLEQRPTVPSTGR